jgi:rhodanese-related sulfurtransferase
MQTITLPNLLAQLEDGAPLVLVEALPTPHYADAHLPGAINLPPDQVDQLAPTLLPNQSPTIVVYCSNRACLTSHRVAQRLTELGYTTVLHYVGGKQEWLEAGLPLAQGSTDADQNSSVRIHADSVGAA